jgi:hypothetical protein
MKDKGVAKTRRAPSSERIGCYMNRPLASAQRGSARSPLLLLNGEFFERSGRPVSRTVNNAPLAKVVYFLLQFVNPVSGEQADRNRYV